MKPRGILRWRKKLFLLYAFWQGHNLIRESQLPEKVCSNLGYVLLREMTIKEPVMKLNVLICKKHFLYNSIIISSCQAASQHHV